MTRRAAIAGRRPLLRDEPAVTHVHADADRACATLAGYGDVGATLRGLARQLRWTQERTRRALSTLRSAGRAEVAPHGAWRVTEAP